MTTPPRPWRSGFCTPGNPASSHDRCPQAFRFRDGRCECTCHAPAVERKPQLWDGDQA